MSPLEALNTLRDAALARVARKLPVAWAHGGVCYRAEPRDDKYPGAWLLCGDRWEQYVPRGAIESSLQEAEMLGALP